MSKRGRKSTLQMQGVKSKDIQYDAFKLNMTVRQIAKKYNISLSQSYRAYMKAFNEWMETHKQMTSKIQKSSPSAVLKKFRLAEIRNEDNRLRFIPVKETDLKGEHLSVKLQVHINNIQLHTHENRI